MGKKTYINNNLTNSKSIRINKDGSILLTGGFSYDSTTVFIPTQPFLHKISSDGQSEIWKRKYSILDIGSEYTHDMILTSDGGILISGYLHNTYTRNDAWLVKFDSCGYTVGDTPTPFFVLDSIENTKESATVFITEQSQNYCTAEIDWGVGSENEFYYAYENNLPLVEKQFQHNYTQNGTYTIKVTTLAGEEYRSYEVDVVIQGISVGIESVFYEKTK